MCLAVFAIDRHPRLRVVIASNRDEYHERPASAAGWWEEGILGGRDLQAGGAWLAVNRRGRWALLTNFRDGARRDSAARSRGELVPRVLAHPGTPQAALASLAGELPAYNGCNVVTGDLSTAAWLSNRGAGVAGLGAGIYGLSNALLDTPWPKVTRTRAALEAWLADERPEHDRLLDALGDREPASDEHLPSTGVPRDWERMLSSPFIAGERYGTRCSTLLTIDRDGRAELIERRFAAGGTALGQSRHVFQVAP